MGSPLPLSKAQTQKTFPTEYRGQVSAEQKLVFIPAGPSRLTTTANHYRDLLLIGKDEFQKEWTVTVCGEGIGLPYYVFTADLDHDGTSDLILVCGTGGCGLAPSAHILVADTTLRLDTTWLLQTPFTRSCERQHISKGRVTACLVTPPKKRSLFRGAHENRRGNFIPRRRILSPM
jgi:hypothetical protein